MRKCAFCYARSRNWKNVLKDVYKECNSQLGNNYEDANNHFERL